MEFFEQHLPGVWVIQPKVFPDPRGYFMESFKASLFEQHIGKVCFLQENESKSTYGVLRGLHAQAGDAAQAKLVRVVLGSVLDVVVDMRHDSPTFGQHLAVELSESNKRQLYIPRGFYHGFLVTSPEAIFQYKVDNAYQPAAEVSMNYADPTLGIQWPLPKEALMLSSKDVAAPMFEQAYRF